MKTESTGTLFAALLDNNTVKLVKTNNFEEVASICLMTNPAQHIKDENYLEKVIKKSLKLHPKTSINI